MNPQSVFTKLTLLDPNCCLSHFTLGRHLYLAGEYKDALVALNRCLDIDPDYLLAYVIAGQACERSGATKQAKRIYTKGEARAKQLGETKFAQQLRALAATL